MTRIVCPYRNFTSQGFFLAVVALSAMQFLAVGHAAAQAPHRQDLRIAVPATPGSSSCPPAAFAREDFEPFIEAMLEPGKRLNMTDMLKDMPPDTMAKIGEMQKAADEQKKRDWPNLCRYQAENAEVLASKSRPRVIFIGDSITENWKRADPLLFTMDALDRGISGQTTPQILLRFYQDVVALRPRAVHIMAGTNDLAGNTGPMTDAAILNNIEAMIDIAKANRIAVVLAGIPPSKTLPWQSGLKPAQRIVKLNQDLAGMAKRRGATFVDYGNVLADAERGMKTALGNDGIHPNRDGYAAMRPLAERAIARALR